MSRQPDPTENKYDEGHGSNKPQFKSECSQVIVMSKFFLTKYCDNSILVSIVFKLLVLVLFKSLQM